LGGPPRFDIGVQHEQPVTIRDEREVAPRSSGLPRPHHSIPVRRLSLPYQVLGDPAPDGAVLSELAAEIAEIAGEQPQGATGRINGPISRLLRTLFALERIPRLLGTPVSGVRGGVKGPPMSACEVGKWASRLGFHDLANAASWCWVGVVCSPAFRFGRVVCVQWPARWA